MTTVREYAVNSAKDGSCSTGGVRGLSQQIFSLLQPALGDELTSCEDIVRVDGPSTIPFLQPAAKAALARAVQEKGERPRLLHAYRTVAQQFVLYHWLRTGKCDISLAAQPGDSPHERAIAIDIRNNAEWRTVLAKHNWRWRGPSDPGHFTYVGSGISARVKKESIRAFQRLWNQYNPDDRIAEDGVYGEIETGPRLLESPVDGW